MNLFKICRNMMRKTWLSLKLNFKMVNSNAKF